MIFISKNLELLRKKTGFKQAELAEKLGVKANTISNYEKGVSQPDYLIVSKLMELFNVSSDQLLYSDLSEIDISRNLIKEEVTESVFDKFLSKINERDRKLDEKDALLKEKETENKHLQSELRTMEKELAVFKSKHEPHPEPLKRAPKSSDPAKPAFTKQPSSPTADNATSAIVP